MAALPELIYCANGNERFARIAIDAGFTYGAQLPGTVYFRPEFVDQDWKRPNRDRYMAALSEHRPRMATVLDWERDEQLPEVLAWAEEAAAYAEIVLIIPKIFGGIARLPRHIAGASVRLGYSVPTRHGGTQVPVWEFFGWPVHLLGGSPHAQMRIARTAGLDIHSVDGNMHNLMATRFCRFWVPGTAKYASNRYWPTLREANGGQKWGNGGADSGAPYEAFRRSCLNIAKSWRGNGSGTMKRQTSRKLGAA